MCSVRMYKNTWQLQLTTCLESHLSKLQLWIPKIILKVLWTDHANMHAQYANMPSCKHNACISWWMHMSYIRNAFVICHPNTLHVYIIMQAYRIVGNFRGRKHLQSGENMIFAEKTFADCSLLLGQRMPCPQISWRKLSRIAIKPWNSWKFSLSKVSRYTV